MKIQIECGIDIVILFTFCKNIIYVNFVIGCIGVLTLKYREVILYEHRTEVLISPRKLRA